jgi:hypothetical protein
LTSLEEYSKKHLGTEVVEIQRSSRALELPELTVFEKAIIYKYSEDGYETLNEELRSTKGNFKSVFNLALTVSLSKLVNFQGLVYRGAELSSFELKDM